MSDEGKAPESKDDPLASLTSLDFGPAWARGESGEKKGGSKEGRGKRSRGGSGEGRGGGGRREGKGDQGRGGRDRREHGDRGRRFDKREGGGRRFDKGRGRRHDDRRGGCPPREEIPVPEGFTAGVMPVEDGLDNLAKEILAGGRTYPVFDLAKLVLAARERFNVSFKAPSEASMYRCKKDNSLWLTKQEALRQLWRADWRREFYEEVVKDVTPPKGNFQAVARCGISGEWLGPPNYHGYQTALSRLHRERFGHMSLDSYKRKIVMERSEEAVNAWLEKMSKHIHYRPTGGAKPVAEEATPSGQEAGEEPSAEAGEEAKQAGEEAEEAVEKPVEEVSEETTVAEEASGEATDEEAVEEAKEEEAPEEGAEVSADNESEGGDEPAEGRAGSEDVLMVDPGEVERHFVEHHFDHVFQKTEKAWVSGNIAGNHLSPGLLALLRETVAEERRYPGKLTPMLCRQLSGRHVAVFKWRGKLQAGPSRPHPVPEDIAIADRPKSLLTWVQDNSGKNIEKLWKELLPKELTDAEKLEWYHDLHWLINQGYVLLMSNSTLHLARKGGEEGKKATKSAKKKEPKRKKREQVESKKEPRKEKPDAREREPSPSPEVAGGRCSGLYARSARTLGGVPKGQEPLFNRGLRPLSGRIEIEDEEDEEDEEFRFY